MSRKKWNFKKKTLYLIIAAVLLLIAGIIFIEFGRHAKIPDLNTPPKVSTANTQSE